MTPQCFILILGKLFLRQRSYKAQRAVLYTKTRAIDQENMIVDSYTSDNMS